FAVDLVEPGQRGRSPVPARGVPTCCAVSCRALSCRACRVSHRVSSASLVVLHGRLALLADGAADRLRGLGTVEQLAVDAVAGAAVLLAALACARDRKS